jgi:predicted small secreted protein
MSRNLWHAKPFLSVVGVGVLLLILAACNVATGGGDDGDAAPNDVENDSVESVDLDSLDF